MKKEYIFPITEISNVEILNMICQSPWDPFSGEEGGDGDDGEARCRNEYGSEPEFGSLW
ncbi:MAG: hypothetical protein J5663_05005 [Bacteroidaceae bacterium]|nr:hypothetical protein [Bacteroidaceae bacterium]